MSTPTPTVLTGQQVRQFFAVLGVLDYYVNLADESYVCPDRDWLLGPFWEWHRQRLAADGLDKWHAAWDCDDFARHFAHSASLSHKRRVLRDGGEGVAQGIAVFEHWYLDRQIGYHAQVVAIIGGPKPYPLCIEPQPQPGAWPVRELNMDDWMSTQFLR